VGMGEAPHVAGVFGGAAGAVCTTTVEGLVPVPDAGAICRPLSNDPTPGQQSAVIKKEGKSSQERRAGRTAPHFGPGVANAPWSIWLLRLSCFVGDTSRRPAPVTQQWHKIERVAAPLT